MGEFEVKDVNLDEFAKQFKEECLENGVVLTICVPKIDKELLSSHKKGDHLATPYVNVAGNGGPGTLALAVITLEHMVKHLLKDPSTKLMVSILKDFITTDQTFEFREGEKNEPNNN